MISGNVNIFSSDFRERFLQAEDSAAQFEALKQEIIAIISRPWDEGKRPRDPWIRAVVEARELEFPNRYRYTCRGATYSTGLKRWVSNPQGTLYENCYNDFEGDNEELDVGEVELGGTTGVDFIGIKLGRQVWLRVAHIEDGVTYYDLFSQTQFDVECP